MENENEKMIPGPHQPLLTACFAIPIGEILVEGSLLPLPKGERQGEGLLDHSMLRDPRWGEDGAVIIKLMIKSSGSFHPHSILLAAATVMKSSFDTIRCF
jgi:hypothetical protein